jgi:hypothetical protein
MKRILWCGGSHLATSKDVISSKFNHAENTFYLTAGWRNRDWSINGGTYSVEGTVVGCNGHEPERRLDLSGYDRIIFVGQYIQAGRYFCSGQLSNAAISAILSQDDFLIRLPNGIYNQPLELFPRLHSDVTLLADPWVSLQKIDCNCLRAFRIATRQFCDKNQINLLYQPDTTLSAEYQTSEKFKRKDGDNAHFNSDFWRDYFDHALAIL